MLRDIPYIPDDPQKAEKKEARRSRSKKSYYQMKSGSREMTEEEQKKYAKRTLGSYQKTFQLGALPY